MLRSGIEGRCKSRALLKGLRVTLLLGAMYRAGGAEESSWGGMATGVFEAVSMSEVVEVNPVSGLNGAWHVVHWEAETTGILGSVQDMVEVDGTLYIATEHGIRWFQGGAFHPLGRQERYGESGNRAVHRLGVADGGGVTASIAGLGLVRFGSEGLRRVAKLQGRVDDHLLSEDGAAWAVTEGDGSRILSRFIGAKGPQPISLGSHQVSQSGEGRLLVDAPGESAVLLVATTQGIGAIDDQGNWAGDLSVGKEGDYFFPTGLPGRQDLVFGDRRNGAIYYVSDNRLIQVEPVWLFQHLAPSEEGSFWLAVNRSLYRVEGPYVYSVGPDFRSPVTCLAPSHEGGVWFGLLDGSIGKALFPAYSQWTDRDGVADVNAVIADGEQFVVGHGHYLAHAALSRGVTCPSCNGSGSGCPMPMVRLSNGQRTAFDVYSLCWSQTTGDPRKLLVGAGLGAGIRTTFPPIFRIDPQTDLDHVSWNPMENVLSDFSDPSRFGPVGGIFVDADHRLVAPTDGRVLRSGPAMEDLRFLGETKGEWNGEGQLSGVFMDISGVLWARLGSRRILRVDRLETQIIENSNVSSISVICDNPAAADSIWVCASDGLYALRDGRWIRSSLMDGGAAKGVRLLFDDGLGMLWAVDEEGVFAFVDPDSGGDSRMLRLGAGDGLSFNHHMDYVSESNPRAAVSASGEVAFALGGEGLLIVDRDRMLQRDDRLVIESVSGRDEDYFVAPEYWSSGAKRTGKGVLKLPARAGERLTVSYRSRGSSLKEPRIQALLSGPIDAIGVDSGRNSVSFFGLPSGDYQLSLCSSPESAEGDQLGEALSFRIGKHWFQTYTFQGASLAGIGGLGAFSVRARARRKYRARVEKLARQRDIERDRLRIARDMHDQLGGDLARMKIIAERSARVSPDGRSLVEESDKALRSMRDIIWAISPRSERALDLCSYLKKVAEETLRDSEIRLKTEGDPLSRRDWDPDIKREMVFVLRGLLANVLGHSKATDVRLTLVDSEDGLEMRLCDNGVGFSIPDTAERGLDALRERLKPFGGTLQLKAKPGDGVTAIVRAPRETQE